MKLTNHFDIIRDLIYLAIIASCFAFTPAKSGPLKFSNVNNNVGNGKSIQQPSNNSLIPIANGDLGSGRTGGEKDEPNNIDSSISKVDRGSVKN